MNKILFAVFFLLSFSVQAADVTTKINKMSMEIDKAEIFAVNCVEQAQANREIDAGCLEADELVQKLSKKLDKVSAKYSNNNEVLKNLEGLRQQLIKIENQLTEAKNLTGNTPWTYSILPRINP